MSQTATDFLRISAQTINKNYSGDPLSRDSFINSIELLESIAEAADIDTQKTIFKFSSCSVASNLNWTNLLMSRNE